MRLEAFLKKNLVKSQKIIDDSISNQIVLQVSSKDIDEVWFLDQAIWREEHTSKDDLRKLVEECEDPECRDHTVIRVSQIKEQIVVVEEEMENVEVVIATLNDLLGSWD